VDQKIKNLSSEELRQPRVVDSGDLVEETRFIHSAFGYYSVNAKLIRLTLYFLIVFFSIAKYRF